MSRGQIGKPEFYIDYMLWLNTVGSLSYDEISYDNAFTNENAGVELISSLLRLDPSIAAVIPTSTHPSDASSFSVPTGMSNGLSDDLGNALATPDTTDYDNWNIDYIAFLNHNFKTAGCHPYVEYSNLGGGSTEVTAASEIINYNAVADPEVPDPSTGTQPDYDGFSIATLDNKPSSSTYIPKIKVAFRPQYGNDSFNTTLFLGAVSIGHKFTPPSSPDMKISMKYDIGYKRKETINGRKVAHLNWFRERGWTQFGIKKHSWNLEDMIGSGAHRFNWRKSGRRTWSIQFSYISDDDMFPSNLNLTANGMEDSLFTGDSFGAITDNGDNVFTTNKTLMSDNSMIAQLLHKTCFGYLPFIFRPDNTYAKADGFCLAMIDMKSFSIKQVAHKMWSVKLKIVELI